MQQQEYEAVKAKLYDMTPSLVAEILAIFEADYDLVNRFGNKLPNIAEQEVKRLRDVLLGALLLDHPPLLHREIEWLVRVASVRNFNLQTVRKHLSHWRYRLNLDLPARYKATVLALYDQATAQVNGLPLFVE